MTEVQSAPDEAAPVIRLTPSEWRTVLERRGFLERDDNRFQLPRRFCGRPVEIVPDASFR